MSTSSKPSVTLAGRTLLSDGSFAQATILVRGDKIESIQTGLDAHADIVTSGWIIPGFIDLQVNGGFGFDVTADPSSAASLAAKLPATGVTSFLPTIISSSRSNYPRLLKEFESVLPETRGAQILGLHLEGPYLSSKRAGAHNPAHLHEPTIADYEQCMASKQVRVLTLAPELPGALELARYLQARGILVSAGHSNASFAEATAGLNAGIAWGTHLYNAMSPLTQREPGLVGALLASDVPCGLIVDGIHVHPAAVKIALRAKGTRGLTLVTDAMAAAGMPPGAYRLGDREVIVDKDSARLRDGTLAGSILQMDAAVRNMCRFAGCTLAEAVTMASTTPARVLHLDRKGEIAPGRDADLVVLDESLHVSLTMVRGSIVYTDAGE